MKMALIMYFTRAPRYKNINVKDLQLVESYYQWQMENEKGSRYSCNTFEEWCGVSDKELPEKEVLNYYKQFFTIRRMYVDGVGKGNFYSLFEQLGVFVKANHIFKWFYTNVMNENMDMEYYEVSKECLEDFLNVCNKVKDSFVFIKKNEYTGNNDYEVNESIAKELLPTFDNRAFFFGPVNYGDFYAENVIKAIKVVNNILETTDFDKQAVYFNVTW